MDYSMDNRVPRAGCTLWSSFINQPSSQTYLPEIFPFHSSLGAIMTTVLFYPLFTRCFVTRHLEHHAIMLDAPSLAHIWMPPHWRTLECPCRLLLTKKIHRLPVVDEKGRLVGVLSRGNIVKAALALRKAG